MEWLTAVLTMSRQALMSVDAPLESPRFSDGRRCIIRIKAGQSQSCQLFVNFSQQVHSRGGLFEGQDISEECPYSLGSKRRLGVKRERCFVCAGWGFRIQVMPAGYVAWSPTTSLKRLKIENDGRPMEKPSLVFIFRQQVCVIVQSG